MNKYRNKTKSKPVKRRRHHDTATSKEVDLAERLRFEKLVTEILVSLVNLSNADPRREIKRAFRMLLSFFEVDRCALFSVSADRENIQTALVVNKTGIKPLPKKLELATFLPWTFQRVIERTETVCLKGLSDLPPEAKIDRKTFKRWGVRSTLWIPLASKGAVRYCIKISSHKHELAWPQEYAVRLRSLGEIIVNFLINKQAELALLQSEERFRKFFEEVPEYCYIISPQGTIIDLNTSALNILGYKKEEIIGKPLKIIYAPESVIKMQRLFKKWTKTGSLFNEEMVIATKHGETRNVLLSANAVRDHDGKILHSVSVQTDITEKTKYEEALLRKEQSVAEAHKVAHLGNWDWNIETNDLYWSAEVYRIFGFQPEDFGATYEAFLDSVHPDDHARVHKAIEKALADPNYKYNIEHRVVRPDGSIRIVHEQGKAQFAENNKPVRMIGTVQDITERRQLQDELERRTVDLSRINEELNRFAEHMSEVREKERTRIAQELHDELGQALTALRMDALWLKKHETTGNADIIRKTQKMMHLIDSTITTVQRISSELRPGMLDDLGLIPAMEWQCNEFQKRYETKCSFMHRGSGVFDTKQATALYRILQESLTNVARHADATEVRVSIENSDRQICMEINDNGKGILDEQISAPSAFGITGMRQRVSALNGTIDIHGSSGKGTTVSITIPYGGETSD